jgi:site-specific DNA recombinase
MTSFMKARNSTRRRRLVWRPGVADLTDPTLKSRVAELVAVRDQARVDAERSEAIGRAATTVTPKAIEIFARAARKRMRDDKGAYRRDHLRALAQRIEVAEKEVRIMGSRTVETTSGILTGLPASNPCEASKWRGPRFASL